MKRLVFAVLAALALAVAGSLLMRLPAGRPLKLAMEDDAFDSSVPPVNPFTHDRRDPACADLVASLVQRFGKDPDFASMFNYKAVMLLVSALEEDARAWCDDLKRIILDKMTCQRPQGEYTQDGFGDVSRPLHLLTVADGRLSVKE